MLSSEYCRGAARITVSNVDVDPVEVVSVYVLSPRFEMLVIEVFRCVVAEAFSILAKICQFPPSIEVAPDVAMQTIVSTP